MELKIKKTEANASENNQFFVKEKIKVEIQIK